MHHRLLFLALAVAACTEPGPDEDRLSALIGEGSDGPTGPSGNTGGETCKTVTVTGSVFYNDLRWQGRFGLRRTPGPSVVDGTRNGYTDDGSHTNLNYLGLLDARIDVYEVDKPNPNLSDADCATTEYLGTTSVAADGAWSWTGTVCDRCNVDFEGSNDENLSFAAIVSLRKCDHPEQRCFSLRDPTGADDGNHYNDDWDGPVWSRWIRSASASTPKVLRSGSLVPTGTDYFQETSTQTAGEETDEYAQAANVFATLVDVTRKVHLEENVPFDYATWGEVKAFFPDLINGTHSHQANRLCVEAPGGGTDPALFVGWFSGDSAAHEYGHLVHYWQWEGTGKYVDLCYQETPQNNELCGESDPQGEYAINAFKEGWADFIRDVTFENTGSTAGRTCDDPEYPPTDRNRGLHYIEDVEHALCNLRRPPTTYAPQFRALELPRQFSLLELQQNLVDVWNGDVDHEEIQESTSFTPGATTPLGICEFARQLVASGANASEVDSRLALTSINCAL